MNCTINSSGQWNLTIESKDLTIFFCVRQNFAIIIYSRRCAKSHNPAGCILKSFWKFAGVFQWAKKKLFNEKNWLHRKHRSAAITLVSEHPELQNWWNRRVPFGFDSSKVQTEMKAKGKTGRNRLTYIHTSCEFGFSKIFHGILEKVSIHSKEFWRGQSDKRKGCKRCKEQVALAKSRVEGYV